MSRCRSIPSCCPIACSDRYSNRTRPEMDICEPLLTSVIRHERDHVELVRVTVIHDAEVILLVCLKRTVHRDRVVLTVLGPQGIALAAGRTLLQDDDHRLPVLRAGDIPEHARRTDGIRQLAEVDFTRNA